jgi:putative ABC transport system permease protein
MRTLWQDLRYGARVLLKRPGFTVIAVLTLALGIGANAAIFSVVNAVLFRALPYPDPDRIVTVWESDLKEGGERDDVSPANFLDWRASSHAFEEMAMANPRSFDYDGQGEPEVFQGSLVSEGFFRILGVEALVGRTFLPEEYEPGRDQVVLLSYGLWRRKFGADPAVVGRKILLRNQPYTVVGVLPLGYQLKLDERDEVIWAPQALSGELREERSNPSLKVIARLKPGVTLGQARAEMSAVASRLAAEHPATNAGRGAAVVGLAEQMFGRWRPALLILLGAVGFVLLIACANVANLLMARSRAREREFAIRAAVGATRGRLVRQLLTESLLLALLGCGCGLLLAYWCVDLIAAFSPADIPRINDVGLNAQVLGFGLLLAFCTALVFGAAPALRFSKPEPHDYLKEGGRAGAGADGRLRSALIVSEIALALMLLVGAGLLVRSFVTLTRVRPGFAGERVVTLQVFIWRRYATPEQRADYLREALERIRTLPGVEAAGAATTLPMLESSVDFTVPFHIEGRPPALPGKEPRIYSSTATAEYFQTLGIPLLKGRVFKESDGRDAPQVVLVNETMARRYWPDRDPLGERINVGGDRPLTFEVVGVVGDVRRYGLEREPRPEFYRPYSQNPHGSLIFVVRTAGDPAALLPSLKARIWEINRSQPFYSVATMEQLMSDSLAPRRFSLLLLGAFAVLALLLAVVGVYGVTSFFAAQRTREIGIRLALGARRGDVLRLVVGHGMRLTLPGVGLGLMGSLVLTRWMAGLLYGVTPTDPLTFAGVSALLVVAALLGCLVPARRATRVDPVVALRYE